MDETHTLEENIQKIEALIDAVHRLQIEKQNLVFDLIQYQLDSLDMLAHEASQSLDAIKFWMASKK